MFSCSSFISPQKASILFPCLENLYIKLGLLFLTCYCAPLGDINLALIRYTFFSKDLL